MLKYITIATTVLSLFLLQMTMSQSDKIDSLSAELEGKTDAIEYMQKKINNLSKSEEKSNKIINELRKKAYEDKCYNTNLPDYIVEQLRKK